MGIDSEAIFAGKKSSKGQAVRVAAEPAPGAVDIILAEHGQELTITRRQLADGHVLLAR